MDDQALDLGGQTLEAAAAASLEVPEDAPKVGIAHSHEAADYAGGIGLLAAQEEPHGWATIVVMVRVEPIDPEYKLDEQMWSNVPPNRLTAALRNLLGRQDPMAAELRIRVLEDVIDAKRAVDDHLRTCQLCLLRSRRPELAAAKQCHSLTGLFAHMRKCEDLAGKRPH